MSCLLALLTMSLVVVRQTQGHDPDQPGTRTPVAGIPGFQSVSRVDFGAEQNRLTAVYIFPDRVRWHFENYAEPRSQHQFFYRQGALVHELATAGLSQAIEGEGRVIVLLQMELRRATMLWPDGFEWRSAEDGTRTAVVNTDTCCRSKPIGTLVADSIHDGRPRTIEIRTEAGRVVEAIAIRGWQEHEGRWWPRGMAVSSQSGRFEETIESIQTRVDYLELSFLPPDRRPTPATSDAGPSIIARDLVAMTYATRTLPDETTWDQALSRARAWIQEAQQALGSGMVVDPVPTFELSPAGRPLRCLVRLSEARIPPPDGYQTFSERAGLFVLLQDLVRVDEIQIQRLLRAAPSGARGGTCYLRLHERTDLPVEVVLPLETRD